MAGAYEAAKERTTASYLNINCTAAILIVVIAHVQSGFTVSTIFGSFLVALAARFLFQCYHTHYVTYTLLRKAAHQLLIRSTQLTAQDSPTDV